MGDNRDEGTVQGGRGADGEDAGMGQTARGAGEGQREARPELQGQERGEEQTGLGPGEGQLSDGSQQQVELPEHQGVMTGYVPPQGGMRSEVGDIDADAHGDSGESPQAGDESLPGHLGGGLAGG